MDMALEATNPRSKYQIYVIIIVVLLPFTTFIVAAGYPYLTNVPIIYCQPKEVDLTINEGYVQCDMNQYCTNPEKYNIKIDRKNSIDSLAEKFSLYCSRNYYSPLINSSFFIGSILGVAIFANYPDRIGRILVLKYLMIINIIVQFNYFFNLSIQHILVIAFISGFTTYCNSVLSLLIVETMDSTWSGIVMSARSASYGLVGITLAFYFMLINNLQLLFFVNIVISCSGFILVKRFFVESPRWLNSKNKLNEAIDCMQKMADINNSSEQFQKFLEVNQEMLDSSKKEIKEVTTNYNLLQIFLLKSQRKLILRLIYVWFFGNVCFYGIFTSLNKNKGNIFLNSIVLYSGEIIAEMSSGILANKYGRVTVSETLSYMGGIAFIISYFISGDSIMKSFILFISGFCFAGTMNLLYIYTNEIFPFSIKALTFGFMYLMSRAGGVAVPIFLTSNNYPIILGCLAISCGYILGKCEETLGRKLQDDVPEADRNYSILSIVPIKPESIKMIKLSFTMRKEAISYEQHFKLNFQEPSKPLLLSNKY